MTTHARIQGRRTFLTLALITALAQVTAGSAGAGSDWAGATRHPNHGQPGGGQAQKSAPAVMNNFEVLSHLSLGGRSGDADVFYFDHGPEVGQFAYVGTSWDECTQRGVKIVDVRDPASPALVAVARLRRVRDVTYEDPVVINIAGTSVLAVGIQICERRGRGGFGLFDVSDPRKPSELSFFPTKSGGVHELDLTQLPDGRTAALLAIPFGEEDGSKDFHVIDITNPRKPTRIAGWGAIKDSSLPMPNVTSPPTPTRPITSCCQGLGAAFADFYFHSARAFDGGKTAYVSHWDLGVVKFDMTDPAHPKPVGRTVYPFDAEGEAHSLTVYDTAQGRYILQNDEDFTSLSPARVRTSATGDKTWAVSDTSWMPTPLVKRGTIEGAVHDADDGCDASDYRGAKGNVALADTRDPSRDEPPCGLAQQIVLAADAGVRAFLVNFVSSDRPSSAFQPPPGALKRVEKKAGRMPVLATGSIDGLARAIRTAPGRVSVTLEPGTPEYGFLRIFSEANATDTDRDGVMEYTQVGEFAGLPHVRGEYIRSHKAGWSIHNTEVWGNRAFISWYSHGIVSLDLTNPASPTLAGQFAPPGGAGRNTPYWSKNLPAVWGVAIDRARGLIYASDVRSGLWIIRPTGPALPTVP